MIPTQRHEARIVTVSESENFPQPHTAYTVVGTGLARRADGDGYERVWDVVLLWPVEEDE